MSKSIDKRILRAIAEVRQAMGDEGELFVFYERLLRMTQAKKATPSLKKALTSHILLQSIQASPSRSTNEPYLSANALNLNSAEFYPWLLSIGELFETRDQGALDEAEAIAEEKCVELAHLWFEEGSASLGPTVDALLANALAPYLERASEQLAPHLPLKQWSQPYCPICGGFPDIGLWDEAKGTQKLLCERCRTEWTIAQEGCVFCGEDDPEVYGFYNTEDDLYRVMVCDSCGYYLKMINHQQAKRSQFKPLLAAERFLTPGLDLLAVQEGYTRPTQIVAFLGQIE